MTICNGHKDEVCYESRECPACEIQNDLDRANKEIEKLESQIEELNKEQQ
jgi:hypothetical protein